MISGSFLNALKGISDEFEINRILGALGCVSYILGANIYIIVDLAQGGKFDLTEYCIAFPGGLLALGLGTAGAVSIKDRNVATSKVIQQTGAVPTAPPAGPPVPPGAMDKPDG